MSKTTLDNANQQYRAYISPINQDSFNAMKDPFVKTNAFKTQFKANLKKALREYGLLERIKASQANHERFTALNLACGEGMYLHLLAELLEEEKLAGATDLFGIDADPTMVATAAEFCKVSKPARPFLRFYLHDLQKPLSKCLGLSLDTKKQVQFDFIFALNSMIYTPQAQQMLERVYRENLKPGGVLYLRDYVASEGPDGWIAPHPALHPALRACYALLDNFNPGINVSHSVPEWLEELGAEQIQSNQDVIPWGGTTQRGRDMMRDIIMLVHSSGSTFIDTKLMSQAEYNKMMQVVYKELTMEAVGQVVHRDTLARKPL